MALRTCEEGRASTARLKASTASARRAEPLGSTATGLPAISGHLTVGGRLTGTLTLHGLALAGHVGGASVHAHLAAL
jgi:hypothetical protein